MPTSNADVVWGSFEAFRAGDYERAMEALAPDVEYDLSHFPGQEIDEVIPGGDKVLVVGREIGRGKGSGAQVERGIFAVWTMEDGVATRIRFFGSREEALQEERMSPDPNNRG